MLIICRFRTRYSTSRWPSTSSSTSGILPSPLPGPHRVLIPGGRGAIQTAFLQPLHESPRHYFNVTEFGLRQWFRMFATERVSVGPNQTIAIALGWFATTSTYHLRDVLDHPKAEEIADSTLRYWTDEWIEQQGGRDHQELWTEVETLPEVVQKTMAAGFEYVGTRTAHDRLLQERPRTADGNRRPEGRADRPAPCADLRARSR